MRATALAFSLGAALVPALSSAEEEPRRYTLEESVQIALTRNSELREADAQVALAEARLGKARAGWLPRLEFFQIFGVVNQARGDAVFSPDDRQDFLNGLGPFTRIDIRLIQPLYTFGKVEFGKRAAEQGLAASSAGRRRRKAEIVTSVSDLYYTVLLNRRLAKELGRIEESLSTALEKARERLEEGDARVTQSDVLKLDYSVARLRRQMLDIRKGELLSLAGLKRAVGLEAEEPYELAEDDLKPQPLELEALESYVLTALANRPELEELEAGIAARQAMVDKARADLLPTFFFMGIVRYAVAPNRTDQRNPFVWDGFNFLDPGFVLGLRWQLSGTGVADIDIAEAQRDATLSRRRTARSGIRVEVERAFRDVESAHQSLELAQGMRRTTRGLMVTSVANFELGVGGADELLEALGMHARSSSDHLLAIQEYNGALLRLRRSSGRLE